MEIASEQLEKLNQEFCELIGIKKVQSFIINDDTEEIRYYSHPSGAYKTPKGWENITSGILSKPIYPDFTNPNNFIKLLNIQWQIFGSLGPQYNKVANESFQVNYLVTKIQGIKMCQSFGGGELLDEYIKAVRECDFEYDILEDL